MKTGAGEMQVGPHDFRKRGWRWWICDACFWPRYIHPTIGRVSARPLMDNRGYRRMVRDLRR